MHFITWYHVYIHYYFPNNTIVHIITWYFNIYCCNLCCNVCDVLLSQVFSVAVKLPMLNNTTHKYALLKKNSLSKFFFVSCIQCFHAYNYIQIFINVCISIMIRVTVPRVTVQHFPIPLVYCYQQYDTWSNYFLTTCNNV